VSFSPLDSLKRIYDVNVGFVRYILLSRRMLILKSFCIFIVSVNFCPYSVADQVPGDGRNIRPEDPGCDNVLPRQDYCIPQGTVVCKYGAMMK
jgi:hypothetical protein